MHYISCANYVIYQKIFVFYYRVIYGLVNTSLQGMDIQGLTDTPSPYEFIKPRVYHVTISYFKNYL